MKLEGKRIVSKISFNKKLMKSWPNRERKGAAVLGFQNKDFSIWDWGLVKILANCFSVEKKTQSQYLIFNTNS